MLKFNAAWRFDSPGRIPDDVARAFSDLIGRIASQSTDRQPILEHFKGYFARAAGFASSWSTNESWAETDLDRYIGSAGDNAPLFIEAFYDACEALRRSEPNVGIPDVSRLNRVLAENDAGYDIQPPDLIPRNPHTTITVPARVASLDEQAQELIQNSLSESERLLSEGRNRAAVQEVLWLLETVSTAFRGLETNSGTVQGRYFNRIAEDLRRQHRGTTLDQALACAIQIAGALAHAHGSWPAVRRRVYRPVRRRCGCFWQARFDWTSG
jgi:hypothetical protein